MRIIVFTGTGGSGVSTLAAATAVSLGRKGLRTFAFSLNPGLNSAFAAGAPAGVHEPATNVRALESRRGRDANAELRSWLEDLLDWRGMEQVLADDLAFLPGINHIGRLLELEEHVTSGEYDAVVLDAAPVNQFLELPPALDAAARWLDRLSAPREQTIFEPFVRAFAGDYASAGEDVMERGRALLSRLAALREMLTDPEKCAVRIVTAVSEHTAQLLRESLSAFHLFSYPTDAVVLSRLLPESGAGPFFEEARAEQEDSVRTIEQAVPDIPVLRKPLNPGRPRGEAMLADLAAEVYGGREPDEILHRDEPRLVFHENGRFEMKLTLPYAAKEDIFLEQLEDSVVVYLAEHRCVLPLPEDVQHWEAASWSFEEQALRVTFKP